MSELQTLITFLSRKTAAHISVHDVAGILQYDCMQLEMEHKIHAVPYCETAKSTPRGFELCLRCKSLANRKAVTGREPFWGVCPAGLLELVTPVVIDGEVACVIYIGNLLPEESLFRAKMEQSVRVTRMEPADFLAELPSCEKDTDLTYYEQMAEILRQAVCRLKKEKCTERRTYRGSVVQNVKEYLSYHYAKNITLKKAAGLYFINEKYLGRLFRAETGRTFHQYLNDIRLQRAAELLRTTDLPVLHIALDCGYSNVTYFNRVFAKHYGVCPTLFRKTKNPANHEGRTPAG